MSSEELENIKTKLKNVADTIRDFMLQLGKLRQDLLDLSSNLEKLTITPEKEKTITTELPPPPTPKPPPISIPQPTEEITHTPEITEPAPIEAQVQDQKIPEEAITTTPAPASLATEPVPAPTTTQKPAETPVPETTTIPESTGEQLNIQTESLESVSDLGTPAIPLSEVVSLLNELEQFCEGSLPAGEVANKIEATKKVLQSLILYHPVYYEMDQIVAKLRATSPDQPLSPTDKVTLLSNIPEWKRRMM